MAKLTIFTLIYGFKDKLTALKKITLIGSGNVATHLGKVLFRQEYIIDTVYSKSKEHATTLANWTDSFAIDNINQLDNTSDIYIVSIKDDIIDSFLKRFPFKDKLIVHTSGSISMDVFKNNGFLNYGIFYPLQTFSKETKVHMEEVPFCIEGCNHKVEHDLINLAKDISSNVHKIDSRQRKKLHLAAVFACNFSNYMYAISEDILIKNGINFDILKPLIKETAKKAQNNSPRSVQTGPAKRKDEAVLKNHIEMLGDVKGYQDIYRIITENIIKSN